MILALIELSTDGLMVGIETPGNPELVKTVLELGQYAAMGHPLHALALVPFGYVASDEGKRYGIQVIGKLSSAS